MTACRPVGPEEWREDRQCYEGEREPIQQPLGEERDEPLLDGGDAPDGWREHPGAISDAERQEIV